MSHYYFLATLLPELKIGTPPEIGFDEFMTLLKENLTKSDMKQVITLRRVFDIMSVREYWKGDPVDPYGNYNENDLEEAFITRHGLPWYVYEFTDRYESKEDRLSHFPDLMITFFREEIKKSSGFLKKNLILERDIRLVLAAFRAKKLGRDIYTELQYENPEDPLVAQILAQKDAPAYEPPEKYEDLKTIFELYGDEPLALHKALLEYRFKKIEEMFGSNIFSLDRILGYMIELILAERWESMDKKKGLQIVDSILKESS